MFHNREYYLNFSGRWPRIWSLNCIIRSYFLDNSAYYKYVRIKYEILNINSGVSVLGHSMQNKQVDHTAPFSNLTKFVRRNAPTPKQLFIFPFWKTAPELSLLVYKETTKNINIDLFPKSCRSLIWLIGIIRLNEIYVKFSERCLEL